ncbi:MAG: bifunctional diaminohydroxyphosphoribosylaminopyrimidine deaminase/5-amino-6-(5-phosphoribosylamino)uracil reductase RibD [Prevotella sp.]
MNTDTIYMRRCLQLALNGQQNARPNPMVGAVIVHDGRIIGEGYHVRCGEGHAEVNAFASVRQEDIHLLHDATIYVSLEPCAHYGKTPPCAELIISKGVRRCVVGCIDPFAKVQGRGIDMIRKAGIEVTVGVLEEECRELNRRFFTFHEKRRPYIILKWAQSADGFIDKDSKAYAFSTPFTQMLVHKLRSECDAILVGKTTFEKEKPRLDVRRWSGRSPMRLVLDRNNPCFERMDTNSPMLPQLMSHLYDRQVQSLLVEGGAATHQSFIDAGLWDEIRIEVSPVAVGNGTRAARMPESARIVESESIDGNSILHIR